jgi:hypothetical protein
MLQTRKNILRRSTTLKQKRLANDFQYAYFGVDKSIRTSTISGRHLVKNLSEEINIDGCDWAGALSIYYYLSPYHRSISDGTNFYFMLPELNQGTKVETNIHTVFLALFHDLYNRCIMLEPWTCPPFRTTLETKYEYIQKLLYEPETETAFAGLTLSQLESLIKKVQQTLKIYPFASWANFREVLVCPRLSESVHTCMTREQIIEILEKYVSNSDAVYNFLTLPIEAKGPFIDSVYPVEISSFTDKICRLVLEKLDMHAIYLQTDVLPLPVDWVHKLDLIINPIYRDGI